MAIPQKKLQEAVKRESFSDWLPYIAYEDGLYLLSDGSLGFIFEVNPLLEAGCCSGITLEQRNVFAILQAAGEFDLAKLNRLEAARRS